MKTAPLAECLAQRERRFANAFGQLEVNYFTTGKSFFALPSPTLDPILDSWLDYGASDTPLAIAFKHEWETDVGSDICESLMSIRQLWAEVKHALQHSDLPSAETKLSTIEAKVEEHKSQVAYAADLISDLYAAAHSVHRDLQTHPLANDLRNMQSQAADEFEMWVSWLPWNYQAVGEGPEDTMARLAFEAINTNETDIIFPPADLGEETLSPPTEAEQGSGHFLDAYLSDGGADLAIRLKEAGGESREGGDDPAGRLLQVVEES
ncbi:hypothetical protein LTR09_011145 [Extremus antarcticus]|uniref:Uncharacterized protein n=1 Tax=Extremus antarcticus TaxID=702011 RepID=A0AAJ0DCE1_9PEZI|nr:hypothetical protein LTR09_011145 [Extremus antarcticus]